MLDSDGFAEGRERVRVRTSRPEDLVEEILTEARTSALGAGGQLPTERQLAEDLNVSRSDVRQALAVLESSGKITRIVGRGTFLRDASLAYSGRDMKLSLSSVSPADVMTARSVVETHAMPLAVAYATNDDIEEMDRCLTGGQSAQTFSEFEGWDLAFHRSLIVATHNPLLVHLHLSIEDARKGQLWGQQKRRSDSTDRRSRSLTEHRLVVDAVKARDSMLAVNSMSNHLASVRTSLFGKML